MLAMMRSLYCLDYSASAGCPKQAAFYKEHRGYVLRVLRRVGLSREHAEDACHDVFLKAFARGDDVIQAASARGWLYRVAVRTAFSQRRSARWRREQRLDAPDAIEATAHHAHTSDDDVTSANLLEALAELSDEARELLERHYIARQTVKQIAAELSCPLQTVYARLRTARLELARHARRRLLTQRANIVQHKKRSR
jgi:RNA polymerase sigma-70 factor (ECF subfamily)